MAILVGLLAVVLFGVAAFAADLSMAYANQRNLQNGADAAVLAVANQIAEAASPTDTCDTVAAEFNSSADTQTKAASIFQSNVPAAAADTPTASLSDFRVTCESIQGKPKQIVVRAAGQQASPVFFGRILGSGDSIDVAKDATAIVGPAGTVVGLRPFAVCKTDADALAGLEGDARTLVFAKGDEGCGTGPGNWGLLDLNGGGGGTGSDNQCDDPDKASLVCWIQHGYAGEIPNPTELNAETGSFGGLSDDVAAILGKEMALPVFDSVTGNGSNAVYHVTGYITVTMCAFEIQGGSATTGACADEAEWDGRESLLDAPADETDPVTAPDDTNNGGGNNGGGNNGGGNNGGGNNGGGNGPANYVQLRYTGFVPIGEIDFTCGFNDSSCASGARIVELAD